MSIDTLNRDCFRVCGYSVNVSSDLRLRCCGQTISANPWMREIEQLRRSMRRKRYQRACAINSRGGGDKRPATCIREPIADLAFPPPRS